jgi:hypothetical protein
MRGAVLGLIGALLIGTSVAAQVAAQDARDGITATIQSQIDALLADDFETAFTFASPAIKRLFQTSERFGSMVREGYPMVWRPGSVRYLDLEDRAGVLYQNVLITDGQGVPHMLEYQMIETPEGWQINGVRIVAAPDVGA